MIRLGLCHLALAALLIGPPALAQDPASERDACLDAPTPECLIDLALATVRGIADERRRASARARASATIAALQAEAGQSDAALATAGGIAHERFRARALGEIAAAQAQAGRIDAAIAVAREIDSLATLAGAYTSIAAALVRR